MGGLAIAALKKAAQAALLWAAAFAIVGWLWPSALRLPQLWMVAAISLLANALQPAYSPFEGQRTSEDRYTAVQIVWTCYGALIASLAELVIEKPALGFDLVTWLSLAVMLAGLGLRTWAVVLLGGWFTWNVAVQPGQELVDRGPYKVIRHPSYTGALLMFLFGCTLLHAWIAASAFAVLLPIAFLRRIHYEEKLLTATLPAYAEYRKRTGAFFPGL